MHMHVVIRYCNTNLVLPLGKLVGEKLEKLGSTCTVQHSAENPS